MAGHTGEPEHDAVWGVGPDKQFTVGVSLKLYMGLAQSADWALSLARITSGHSAIGITDVFVAPSFPALLPVGNALRGSGILLAAQDVFWESVGPFTGEVGAGQLVEAGCSIVEVGHAERRRLFGETDGVIAAKAKVAAGHGLRPLVCVGEPTERSPNLAAREVVSQAECAFSGCTPGGLDAPWLIAYEPHWAIGRDVPASSIHIVTVINGLSEWGRRSGHRPVILYGGSAGPGLFTELVRQTPHLGGLFLGRSAHDPRGVLAVLDEVSVAAGLPVGPSLSPDEYRKHRGE